MQIQTYAVHFSSSSHSFLLEIWDYLAERDRSGLVVNVAKSP